MKRSNPNMNKPSLGKVNFDLGRWKADEKSDQVYTNICQRCGKAYTFKQKDIKDKVMRCPECGEEEIFFECNFI